MTSVVNEVAIDSGSAGPSFGMGNPQQGHVAGDEATADGVGHSTGESRVSMELDPVELENEVDGTGLERGEADRSGSPEGAPGDVETAMAEARVSESDVGEGVSADAGAGAEPVVADPEEGGDFEEDSLSDEAMVSDGVRIPHGAVGNWMNGFELGDMVWGKVKSHPWWPGHIFNEAFASPSVRRTRREGHVLVAFFGDSSYGWFDPAELVPFDAHYDEKSKQTTLRPFVKAVEEAVDEASRREALALACHCRNAFNFRPAHVPGYFFVDVPGFEPGGVYSLKQINNARDKFVADKALSFVQQTALDPVTDDFAGVERIKSIAMMLAYRRAVFEEFDDTYAQAFGVEPVRPSPRTGAMPDQPERFATRAAPLSGPLVLPEPLRHKKSSSHKLSHKVPSSAKKNKYLLKRRDEQEAGPPKPLLPDFPSLGQPYRNYYNLFPNQQPQQQISGHYAPHIRPTLVFQDASHAPASAPGGSKLGDYVLQKRAPAVPADDKPPQASQDRPVLEQKIAPAAAEGPIVSPRQASDDSKFKSEPPIQLSEIEPRKPDPDVTGAPYVIADSTDGHEPPALLARPADGWKPKDAKAVGGIAKKIKKRLREDGSSDGTGEVKKKKKKKKEQTAGIGLTDHAKVSKIEDPHRKSAGKSSSIGHELMKRGDGVEHAMEPPALAVLIPKIDLSSHNLQLPDLVSDLQELALDPYYGLDRDAPWVALHVFCKFRSMVYQKSLTLPPASEVDTPEVQAGKHSAAVAPQEPVAASAEMAPAAAKAAKDERAPSSTLKPQRAIVRPDDPTVAGRKRIPSDRQEEMSAKRQKKLNKLKALAGDKKAAMGQKGPEGQQRDQKETAAATTTASAAASAPAVPAKPNNKAAEPVKKQDPAPPPPPRPPSPTTLVMKFPPRTTLPSVASLKARFARFGPLELSGTRVYWKSNTCKVVYKFKPDAESALNYARSNEMFGQVKVHFYLRDADALAPEPSADAAGQSRPSEGLQFRPGNGASSGGGVSFGQPRPLLNPNPKPTGQLKSILKKPSDDAGPSGGGRETPRVKFMLDTGDGKAEPPLVGASNNNGRGNAEAPPSSSLPPIEPLISKTPKSVSFLPPPSLSRPLQSYPSHLPPPPLVPSSSVSLAPPPPPLHRATDRVLPPPPTHRSFDGAPARSGDPRQHSEAEGRGKVNKEFANQMLSLLVRCSDIVTGVKSSPGYVPYHSL